MISERLAELLKLPADERIELALALWESLADAERESAFEVTDELRADLDREMAEHLRDPGSSISWEDALRRLKSGT